MHLRRRVVAAVTALAVALTLRVRFPITIDISIGHTSVFRGLMTDRLCLFIFYFILCVFLDHKIKGDNLTGCC